MNSSKDVAAGESVERVLVITAARNEDSIDVAALLRALVRGKFIILLCIVAALTLAVVDVKTTIPLYRVQVVTAVAGDPSSGLSSMLAQSSTIASLVGVELGQNGNRKSEYMALVSSRRLVGDFLTKNNIMPVIFAA